VPNHVCVVVNMVDRLVATRGDDDRRRDAGRGARKIS
jgi:D-serine deaminase-like pyridoxal phosphate-dependent protein